MDVLDLPLEQIIPYARNPRNNAQAIATVAASIQEFGWRQPIVVDEADATAMRRTRRIDNIEAIDGLNRAMMATTNMIGEAIRARGERMAAAGATQACDQGGRSKVNQTL